MNQIILASHGGLSKGALDTVRMIVGEIPNVHAISLERDDTEPLNTEAEAIMSAFSPDDEVYVLTDMLGSSVNNSMIELMAAHGNVTVIAGMNMPLILTLALKDEPLSAQDVRELIAEGRRGIVDCAHPSDEAAPAPKPAAAAAASRGGQAKVVLSRLDYRLLHGQVVFSWVSKVGAERIIVVDNDAALDEVKKSALKLAKPAGVRLNIFTVGKALEKMEKLNTLGEKVMFVFGNTAEMLEFYRTCPIGAINLGATANHDGARQIGGKDSSVFLDEAQRADINALMDLGIQLYVQQTPAYARVNVSDRL